MPDAKLKPIRKIALQNVPNWIAWSHDGKRLALGTENGRVTIYSSKSWRKAAEYTCGETTKYGSWAPDNRRLAIVEPERITIRDWDSGKIRAQRAVPDRDMVFANWHPSENHLAVNIDNTLRILEGTTLVPLKKYTLPAQIYDGSWQDSTTLAVAHGHGVSKINITNGQISDPLMTDEPCFVVAASPKQEVAIGADEPVVVFTRTNIPITLEHHAFDVAALSWSHDGHLLASADLNGNIVVWQTRDWTFLTGWYAGDKITYDCLKLSPVDNTLAVATDWSLLLYDISNLVSATAQSVHYTTAKIALAGDSGVGKTGLGWVLTHDEFKEHPSTHGEQFWVADRLSTTRADGTQCEAVVWDLAGQPDYRLIHSIFVDDADVGLVVFDPTNRQEPLKGAEFWLRALRKCHAILVGARIDRGTGTLSEEEIGAFATVHGVAGGYIPTSAMRGDGIDDLTKRIAALIDWDKRPATVTLETFKHIKDHVLEMKAAEDVTEVLVTLEQLQERLQERTGTRFEVGDIDTATKHLANHGYVRHLRNSQSERFVLLSPDLLNNLAASMVLEARRNPKGLGALDEKRVLGGDYAFPELTPLQARDREILLDAATSLFIDHNICFRETLGNATYLIFPSLINQNKPAVEESAVMEGTAYTVTGATENVYASLVVLLGYTNTFTRTNQWRNQAQYEMGDGEICGFRLTEEREGEIDLVLYSATDAATSTRQLFQGLFEKFLLARDVEVEIFPPVECPKCKYAQPRSEVIKRQRELAKAMFCSNCGKKVALPERILTAPTRTAAPEVLDREQHTAAKRTQFEKAITWLKGYLRDNRKDAPPSCFVSYAWGDPAQERWVERNLATDLRNAGVEVILDRWHNKPGATISKFIDQIERVDFVALVGTPRLRVKYDAKNSDPVVAAELKLINARLMKREAESERIVPLLLEGEQGTSFPPLATTSVFIDFRDEALYFERMFDLLLTLYRIPFAEPAMRDLRDTIRDPADRRRRR